MKILAHVETSKLGSRIERVPEIDDYEFEGMSESERDAWIDSFAWDEMIHSISTGWKAVS